jgi:hypothetical protein
MATTAESHLNKIKDLLLGQDVSGQVELLLNLLSDAAAGKELSNVLSEVIQVNRSIWEVSVGASAGARAGVWSVAVRM